VTTPLEKLQNLLRELFQLDQADLDFGIYRIMNHNREEIVRFLQEDLLPQVQAGFGEYERVDKERLEEQLAETIRQAQDLLGVTREQAEQSPKAVQLKEQIQAQADITQLEQEVYDYLYRFFRRYYHEGDFLSLRRYTDGAYAIPYNGEEVKLHWANADQYYIKTAEHFQNYAFKLPSERRVRFEIVSASTEQNNNKPVNGRERRFILCEADPAVMKGGDLVLRFEYRADEQKRKQDALNQVAYDAVMALPDLQDWQKEFAIKAPTEKNPDRTLLQKYLADFTARNTFDYFIHKSLGKFLRRELDFYIKSEVINLADIQHESPIRVKHLVSKVRVLNDIGDKIIQFLEQIEEFQKKLWLKKKFVLETHYCITLDRVPEDLYPEIIANQAQIEEWKRLFAIDEIEGDLVSPGYSEPLGLEFLKANSFLLLDTQFYDSDFKFNLLSHLNEIDEVINGILISSDCSQALNFLHNTYKSTVRCSYIDPPYNTGGDGFIYKDNYRHSSWMSMVANALSLVHQLLSEQDGSIFISIDDNECSNLIKVGNLIFGSDNFIANVIWQKIFSPKNTARHFSEDHDYILVYARDAEAWEPEALPRSEEARSRYSNPDDDPRGDWSSSDLTDRSYYSEGQYEVISPSGEKFTPPQGRYWAVSLTNFKKLNQDNRICWGEDGGNMPRLKRFLSEVKQGVTPQTLWKHQDVGNTQEAKKELMATVTFANSADVINTVKPTRLIRRVLKIGTSIDQQTQYVLDFFAGSGTTGDAVIKQNLEDGGNRKYILVEMAGYFDAILKPRIQRTIYSKDRKSGKPVSRQGSSHCFKYLRLESYEDALNNIKDPQRTQQQELALERDPCFREEYMLTYKLDTEARGSASLLNPEAFIHPFNYQLKTTQNDDTRYVTVDLIETFNYLLGLTVQRLNLVEAIKTVRGVNRRGDRVLIVWRDLDEVDNDALDDWFKAQGYDQEDPGFDLVYVNGDNNLENLRPDTETWRVLLTDAEFHRLMFDMSEV